MGQMRPIFFLSRHGGGDWRGRPFSAFHSTCCFAPGIAPGRELPQLTGIDPGHFSPHTPAPALR